jgi:hypothetical protein
MDPIEARQQGCAGPSGEGEKGGRRRGEFGFANFDLPAASFRRVAI